jgi:hypothetical protein
MNGSKCERCGFVDWVVAIQCKQCGALLTESNESSLGHANSSAHQKTGSSKLGLTLAAIYLVVVLVIVGNSFRCGAAVDDKWSPVVYCLSLTLTICSLPSSYVVLLISAFLGLSGAYVLFPSCVLGITINTLFLYKLGKWMNR